MKLSRSMLILVVMAATFMCTSFLGAAEERSLAHLSARLSGHEEVPVVLRVGAEISFQYLG